MGKNSVLILSDGYPPYDKGGAERIAYYHAQALIKAGFRVGVITSQKDDAPASLLPQKEEGVLVYRVFHQKKKIQKVTLVPAMLWNPSMRKKLNGVAKNFSPDIIHAHQIHATSYDAFTNMMPFVPHILTFHGYQYECPKGGLYRTRFNQICRNKPAVCNLFSCLMHNKLSKIDRIIAISHFIKDRLIKNGYDPSRIVYIPNGVPNLKTRKILPYTTKNIMYVGRITKNKGVHDLVAAFKNIRDADARLIIAGEGNYLPIVRSLAEGDKRIEFVGWRKPDEIAGLYQKSRIVVVPSLWHEVMNTVICEAQSWGRPVIATRVGGNDDLIENGVSGIFYEPGDVQSLQGVMTDLLHNETLSKTLGENGFKKVNQYGMARHIASIKTLYNEYGCRS